MDLNLNEALQFHNDLFMVLVGALDQQGVLPRDDLAAYLAAIAEQSDGNRKAFFQMMSQTCSRPNTAAPHLHIVE